MTLYSPSTPNHLRWGTPAKCIAKYISLVWPLKINIHITKEKKRKKKHYRVTHFLLEEACTTLTHNEAEGVSSSQIPEGAKQKCLD